MYISVQLIDVYDHPLHTWYLVRLPSVGKGFPHCNTKTPHVTFTGEFVEIYTFWSIPFQGPFTRSTSLYNVTTDSMSLIHQRQSAGVLSVRRRLHYFHVILKS